MNERIKTLSDEIQKLTSEEQALLLDELLAAFHEHPDPEIELAWAREAERRLAAHDRGETASMPAEDVMAGLRARFSRRS